MLPYIQKQNQHEPPLLAKHLCSPQTRTICDEEVLSSVQVSLTSAVMAFCRKNVSPYHTVCPTLLVFLALKATSVPALPSPFHQSPSHHTLSTSPSRWRASPERRLLFAHGVQRVEITSLAPQPKKPVVSVIAKILPYMRQA